MQKYFLREKIQELIFYNSVGIEEYQDKFYFVKNLKTLFPELKEDNIYKAIEAANRGFNPPRRRKKYINLLINKLVNFNIGL